MAPRLVLAPVTLFACTLFVLADKPAGKDPAPKRFTLQGKDLPLSKVLQALREQTGVEAVVRRSEDSSDDDPKLTLNLQKVTFWQALDTVAKEADLRINLYHKEGVALVEGPYKEVPVSHSGFFRVALKRLTAARDLESDAHACTAHLEVAWEPGVQVYLLEVQADSLDVQDDKGRSRELPEGSGSGKISVSRRTAEVPVQLPALPRPVPRLGLLKGKLTATAAGKLLPFTFDKLAKGKEMEKTLGGVTVKLTEFEIEEDIWTFGLSLKYPPDGPQFESFQSWVLNNKVFLQNAAGKRFPENAGYEVLDSTGSEASVRYRFEDDRNKGFVRGKPGDWKLIYYTPEKIVEMTVPFEFKDVPLP